ncbi:cytochrome bc1 complex diheme cytochrome c subunit [Nocardioides montaniterrae]
MRLLNRSAGRLSRYRRGPIAGLVVLLLGLLLTGGLYAAFSPAQAHDDTTVSAAQIEKGRELFTVSCAFCHGQNGQGVLTQGGSQYGPALTDVGAAAVDFQVGTGRMPMANPGVQAPRKEPVFSQEEIADLAAYVATLGTGPAIPDTEMYSTDGMSKSQVEELVQRGGQIFLANCTACHNFEGSGGAMPRGGFAPRIRDVDSKYIYEAMLTGPQSMDTFSDGNIPPEDKKAVIAYLRHLQHDPSYSGLTLGGLGPVSEGLIAWVVGLGLLVGFAVWIAAHTTRTTKKKDGASA